MAKRDPEKTARNRIVASLTSELKSLLPDVLKATGFDKVQSLHGKIGGKHADYIDIQNEVISSPEHFISLWLQGYQDKLALGRGKGNEYDTYELLKKHKIFQEYLFIFLKRTYIEYYESLSKLRPSIEDAEVWIGQNNADYGLLITPRFVNGKWENDKSEIRHFKPKYWSIGHVLETGLVIPDRNKRRQFKTVDEYLDFFEDVLVRNSGSEYERDIAERYSYFVRNSKDPLAVPLLIPEFRYDGQIKKHKYRLDFTIIESKNLNKIGFELSPWSSHGYLSKIKSLTQAQINDMARGNFEDEMKKHRSFFKKHGIFVQIYTDNNLKDIESIFNDMEDFLKPKNIGRQLEYHIFDDFFKL